MVEEIANDERGYVGGGDKKYTRWKFSLLCGYGFLFPRQLSSPAREIFLASNDENSKIPRRTFAGKSLSNRKYLRNFTQIVCTPTQFGREIYRDAVDATRYVHIPFFGNYKLGQIFCISHKLSRCPLGAPQLLQ